MTRALTSYICQGYFAMTCLYLLLLFTLSFLFTLPLVNRYELISTRLQLVCIEANQCSEKPVKGRPRGELISVRLAGTVIDRVNLSAIAASKGQTSYD